MCVLKAPTAWGWDALFGIGDWASNTVRELGMQYVTERKHMCTVWKLPKAEALVSVLLLAGDQRNFVPSLGALGSPLCMWQSVIVPGCFSASMCHVYW